jgi:hypothetical protein
MTVKRLGTFTAIMLALCPGLPSVLLQARPIQEQKESAQVEHLLSELRDPQLRSNEPEKVFQAISQLGKMKSVAAIDDLVNLLSFERPSTVEQPDKDAYVEIHLVTTSDRYPATGALIDIGKPALSALVGAIKTHPIGSLESENATDVILMILRERPADAIEYLDEATAQTSAGEERKRLRHALAKANELQKRLTQR